MRTRKRRALEASLLTADSQNTLLGYAPTITIRASYRAVVGPTCQKQARRDLRAQMSYATKSNKGRTSPWSTDPKLRTSAYEHNLMEALRCNYIIYLVNTDAWVQSTQVPVCVIMWGILHDSLRARSQQVYPCHCCFILGHHFASERASMMCVRCLQPLLCVGRSSRKGGMVVSFIAQALWRRQRCQPEEWGYTL